MRDAKEVPTAAPAIAAYDLPEVRAHRPWLELMNPDGSLIRLTGADGELLVEVARDGTIVYGEGYKPDEAARRFWEAIATIDYARGAFEAWSRG